MKNKFFVFIEATCIIIFYELTAIGLFAWFITDNFCKDVWLLVCLVIMLLIVPLSLLVWSIIYMMPRLELTEQEIIKSLFGKKIKKFKWDEVKYIYAKGNYNQWIFISKKDLSKKSLAKNRLSKDCIYFFKSAKKMAILEHYLPEYLKEQVKI